MTLATKGAVMNGSVTHSVLEWLQILLLGGLIGALGQAARTIVGLKKVSDAASSQVAPLSGSSGLSGDPNVSAGAGSGGPYHATTPSDLIVASRLVVSLAIGFVVGALSSIVYITDLTDVSAEVVFAVAAAGYAGADFIEGFMTRAVGAPAASPGQSVTATGGAGQAGTVSVAGGVAAQSDDAVG